MAVGITRRELGAGDLRREAGRCWDAKAARRMLALALVLEGHAREAAARAAGMDRQTLRDWVHRDNEQGLAGLSDRRRPGRKPRLTPGQEADRASDGRGAWPRSGPGWRGALAAGRPEGVDRSPLGGPPARALGRQGAASARLRPPVGPAEAPAERSRRAGGVQKGFAALVATALPEHARGRPVEIWFQDAWTPRVQWVGQQGTLTRVWARRGTPPRAPRDRRYAWAYLFGAVCPERAVGAGLVLPYANAAATGP